MTAGSPIMECVPNISEGRDPITIAALRDAVCGVPLLDVTSDSDHHRTVFTFAGPPAAVRRAVLSLAAVAFRRLTLTGHNGVHPRIGVLDVLPFIPVSDCSLPDCALLAREMAAEIWRQFAVPSFFYEAAGVCPLETVRHRAARAAEPDCGMGRHPTAGAVAVGARKFLVAWNIWLETGSLDLARHIARRIRASSGGFLAVKALGLPLASRNLVQVSINSVDCDTTPLHVVFERVTALAEEARVPVLGSELIGLIPQRALDLSRGHDLRWLRFDTGMIFERRYIKESASHPCP